MDRPPWRDGFPPLQAGPEIAQLLECTASGVCGVWMGLILLPFAVEVKDKIMKLTFFLMGVRLWGMEYL